MKTEADYGFTSEQKEQILAPYVPVNPVATFVDEYGDVRTIHRKKGRRLSVANEGLTPQQRMNRAAAILMGAKIRARRIQLGLSMRELCVRAGFMNANPKQYIAALEKSPRQEGMRFGTLYALSLALECAPADLMPSKDEVIAMAEIKTTISIAR